MSTNKKPPPVVGKTIRLTAREWSTLDRLARADNRSESRMVGKLIRKAAGIIGMLLLLLLLLSGCASMSIEMRSQSVTPGVEWSARVEVPRIAI